MKYNIIGDIHGQPKWKDLIIDGAVNIFVGDYFSPYFPIPFEEQEKNFKEIMRYREEHNNEGDVVTLLGNHDLEYFFTLESYSRHDRAHERKIEELFNDYVDNHEMAYSIEDKVLVTHAGVTKEWFGKVLKAHGDSFNGYGPSNIRLDKMTPDLVASVIDDMFNIDQKWAFEFHPNAAYWDSCGESPTQSCVWIRPWVLRQHDLFEGRYKQVFGHTINKSIAGVYLTEGYEENCLTPLTDDNANDFNLYMVDCLSYDKASLVYDSETERFSINKPKDDRI